MKKYLSEEELQKEIDIRLVAVNTIIETKEERRIQLKKIEYLRDHLMMVHAKKSKNFYREKPSKPEKTPEQELKEKMELLKLIDSVGKKDDT